MILAYSFLARKGEGRGDGEVHDFGIYREPPTDDFFTTTFEK